MKKGLVGFVLFFVAALCFAKELEGKNLAAVNKALDVQLFVNDFEDLSEQLAYIQKIEHEIFADEKDLSDEARLLCKNILIMQRENSKTVDLAKKNKDKKKKDKENSKEFTAAAQALAQTIFDEYKAFADSHENLSCHFYLHYLQADMTLLGFLPPAKQLSSMKRIIDEYKSIDERYPDYAESLYTYGMILYMTPKIAGGDKVAGLEKIKRATEVPASNFEKAGALTLYSQLMFEEKNTEESKLYLEKAMAIAPNNKSFIEMQEMNEKGYSMFKMQE